MAVLAGFVWVSSVVALGAVDLLEPVLLPLLDDLHHFLVGLLSIGEHIFR